MWQGRKNMAIWMKVQKTGLALVDLNHGNSIGMEKISSTKDIPKRGSWGWNFYQIGNELFVARYAQSDRRTYIFRFTQDGEYRLGPQYAHRVKTPAEEQDPIKKVLREFDFPQNLLVRVNTGEEYEWRPGYENMSLSHNGKESPRPEGFGKIITGATWARERINWKSLPGTWQSRVSKIIIWGDCDPQDLRLSLVRARFDWTADLKFWEAVQSKNLSLAQEWVKDNFNVLPRTDGRWQFVTKHRDPVPWGSIVDVKDRNYWQPDIMWAVNKIISVFGVEVLQH